MVAAGWEVGSRKQRRHGGRQGEGGHAGTRGSGEAATNGMDSGQNIRTGGTVGWSVRRGACGWDVGAKGGLECGVRDGVV